MTANTPQFEFVPAISEIAREAGALLMALRIQSTLFYERGPGEY